MPRKQGKTELVAAGGLFLLLGQGRKEQRIYTASGDVEQASLIFRAACDMIRNDPELESRVTIYEGCKQIDYPEGRGTLKVLSSVPKSKHGLGPTAVLIDEFHVVDEELVNVLTTGFGARRDPLTWMITTAGWDRQSLCFDEWQYAKDVRDGRVVDPTYLPVIFAAEPEDDWTSEETWHEAMPALGDFCSIEFIREEFKKACERPRFKNTFKQLYLNLWTQQAVIWLDVERWDNLPRFDPGEHAGEPCWAGFDAGITGDMCSLAQVWPNELGGHDARCRFWAPEDGSWKREPKNVERYRRWAAEGHLTLTPGEATDFDRIEADVLEADGANPFTMLFADRAYAGHLLSRLYNNHDLKVKGIAQGPVTLNGPMVRLESMVLDGRIRHTGDPILAWNVANAATRKGPTGLMYLDKLKATNRIDGLAALIDAIAAADAESGPASPYETRGLLTL